MVSGMRGKLKSLAVLTVVAVACTSSGTPATTPTSVPATTTSTSVPPTSSTTTAEVTTTTIDRLAEIEAIFQDLEERRLQALYDGDRETFRSLFANDEYMERSMGVFDLIEFMAAPDLIVVDVLEILADGDRCVSAVVFTDATQALGTDGSSTRTVVLERDGERWGFSYIGEGWVCEGPHPLSS